MSWVDLIIIVIIVISALISLVRGFVKESISLASWMFAGFIAFIYFTPLADLLEPYIESPTIRTGSSFAILFVSSLIVGAIINFMVSQLVSKTGLTGTDKSLGVVFGTARGVLIVVIVLALLTELTPMPSESWWQESSMIEYFASMASWIKDVLPEDIAGKFSV
jgi:membrane protein required for colicin V production